MSCAKMVALWCLTVILVILISIHLPLPSSSPIDYHIRVNLHPMQNYKPRLAMPCHIASFDHSHGHILSEPKARGTHWS